MKIELIMEIESVTINMKDNFVSARGRLKSKKTDKYAGREFINFTPSEKLIKLLKDEIKSAIDQGKEETH